MPKKSIAHLYTDLQAFERLMLLIATFVRYPGVGNSDFNDSIDTKSGGYHDALTEVSVRLQEVARDCGIDLPAYSLHTLRKDLRTLRHYNILDNRMYRWGYYLGTGAMSLVELQVAFNALSSQAKYQQDPQVNKIYQILMRRLRGLNLADQFAYPVRAQINRAIIYTDPEEMMADSKYRGTLFEKLEQLESAIIRGQAIEIYRSRNAYQKGITEFLNIYPLQLIYSDIAWYLLHEDCQNGHLAISRLDRFTEHFKLLDSKGRDSTEQWQSLQVAHQLLENGWGLYLGKQEEQSLERQGKLDFVKVTVRFFPDVMVFIQEGEKRHKSQKISFGAKTPDGKPSYLDYRLKLPSRSLTEFSRWVYRFMGSAQFLTPKELVEKHKQAAQELLARYL
ncbi:helix-turn-helix transcriptional regulator [Nostoc sp. 'Peltigera membranacea cyanobiont' 232]|uniref:helix-turn-helix transcriptional regulator n=1 Tax=Nostoc sp. 'Peltigera membranacea cyanobiont' 232 TaxID=2014531 RepID=UPI000B958905|nr:WYL domain-containing protein [Nostoc sp. 'Peltigera membranacea cyanobiont' 232]OYE00771.1 WYL domain-containing protein [Nostoc sp. 'Peltigera membranacea cyanobiont' 232]